jgi:periplasmic divalent cation tolerance protein
MDAGSDFLVVLVTAPNEETAAAIVRKLVETRCAACGNIIRNVRSIYRWKGRIEDESEVLAIIKTRADKFDELKNTVVKMHPYEVPEIVALPIRDGAESYLAWLSECATPQT